MVYRVGRSLGRPAGRPATTRDGLAFSRYRGALAALARSYNLLLRAYRRRGIIVRCGGGGGDEARGISHSREFTLARTTARDRDLAITFATRTDFRFDSLPGLIRCKTKKLPTSRAITSSSAARGSRNIFRANENVTRRGVKRVLRSLVTEIDQRRSGTLAVVAFVSNMMQPVTRKEPAAAAAAAASRK